MSENNDRPVMAGMVCRHFAPGGASYLDELVSIVEEYQWDWTCHAFREWDGWSLEQEGTPANMEHRSECCFADLTDL